MLLSQDDIQRLLAWWDFIEQLGEQDDDEAEIDLVNRLKAHCETATEI